MKFISHRGNLYGPNTSEENSPTYIESTLKKGFDVEIDIWMIGSNLFTGHDQPIYKISEKFIQTYSSQLWLHCKNLDSLRLSQDNFNCFMHDRDDAVFTSKGYIWHHSNNIKISSDVCLTARSILAYPGKAIFKNSLPDIYGLCTDYILEL